MLRNRILITCGLATCTPLLVATIARAAPVRGATSGGDDKHQQQVQSAAQAARLPTVSINSPAIAVQLSVHADMLYAQWLLKNSPQQLRLALPNPDVVATAQIFPPIKGSPGVSHGFFVVLRDFSPPGSMSIWTTLSSTDGRVQLARDFESATVSGSAELIEDAPPLPGQVSQNIQPVRLTVRETNESNQQEDVKLNFSAATFLALCHAHPAETQKYLRPIFHDLGEEASVFAPDPAAVWQALADDWKPDSSLIKSVNDAIASFDADDFRDRQSAGRALRQLGEPAALTLMHTDRSKFSVAVNSGIDTFLAPYLPLSPEEAKRFGRDRDFLLDSQYCDDLSLRELAAARLAKVTGHSQSIDPAADPETRLAQVRAARLATTHPATAP